MTLFDPTHFRQQFPLLENFANNNQDKLQNVYFDNAATTQKPQCVIEVQQRFYHEYNANVHRSSHALSSQATHAFEQARESLKKFINAKHTAEIIWTKGATESINLVSHSLARELLAPYDEIVLSVSEHHANIVPWQLVAAQTGAVIKILPITEEGIIDVSTLSSVINNKTKIVVCGHISNVLGRINPIELVIARAKHVGAYSLIDGAQAVAHLIVDVQKLDCDFYVFSAHKMFGPTGVGVLYGKKELLNKMQPYQGGGEMIKQVSFNTATTFNQLPFKFEAGTPNIAGVIGFGQAASFLHGYLADTLHSYANYEKALSHYCYQALDAVPAVTFITQGIPDIGVIAFTLMGHHNHDVATTLDSMGIAVRSGHHCAMPLMESLALNGCLRLSLAAYNTFGEVDYFIQCLQSIIVEQDNISLEIPSVAKEVKYNIINQIQAKLTLAKGWDSRHREIMLLGKGLVRLDKSFRNESSLISGCESQAWLVGNKNAQGNYTFGADSDAKIIRGLLVIVLAVFNHKSREEIHTFDIEYYFKTLGLLQHLSPSRGNGLIAIVDRIREISQ